MSNPVPPPGGYPPPPAQGQPGYPSQGQPSFPAQGQPGYPSQGQPGFPPGQPAQGGYPQQPGGYPQPGQGGYAQPGQPVQGGYPQPGQPSFPPPPPGQPGGPEAFGQFPTEKKKRSGRSLLVRIGSLIVLVIIGVAVKFGLNSAINPDKAKQAKVGDCVAAQGKVPTQEGKTTSADAKVVDCNSTDAAYTVVGRVNGETDTNSKSCDKFFTDEKADYFVYSSTNGSGYLLCLQAKKA